MVVPEHPTGALRHSMVEDAAQGQINLHVSVVSPERPLFEGAAHWVNLTGVDGQFGIWPRHVAMVAALGSGPLRIGRPEHEVLHLVVRGGFVSVADDVVTILVDKAVTKGEVDEVAARRELDETIAALGHPANDAEFRELLDLRAWSQERLKLANA